MPNSSDALRKLVENEPSNVSHAQVAVLAERVDTMLTVLAEMRGTITQIGSTLGQMAVFQERLQAADQKFVRLFELSDATQVRLAALESEIKSGTRIARLGLWSAPFMIAALVWGHAELLALRKQDADYSGRITLLEFLNGAKRPGAPLSMPPDTSAAP